MVYCIHSSIQCSHPICLLQHEHIEATLRPRQNNHHFACNISRSICLNQIFEFWLKCSDVFPRMKKFEILITIQLNYVPESPVDQTPALSLFMAWHQAGIIPNEVLIHWARNKMVAISLTAFSNAFSWMKSSVFWFNFTEVCSWAFDWQYVSIGSGNGLAPNRWQAIIWTNDGLVYFVTWPQWVNAFMALSSQFKTMARY